MSRFQFLKIPILISLFLPAMASADYFLINTQSLTMEVIYSKDLQTFYKKCAYEEKTLELDRGCKALETEIQISEADFLNALPFDKGLFKVSPEELKKATNLLQKAVENRAPSETVTRLTVQVKALTRLLEIQKDLGNEFQKIEIFEWDQEKRDKMFRGPFGISNEFTVTSEFLGYKHEKVYVYKGTVKVSDSPEKETTFKKTLSKIGLDSKRRSHIVLKSDNDQAKIDTQYYIDQEFLSIGIDGDDFRIFPVNLKKAKTWTQDIVIPVPEQKSLNIACRGSFSGVSGKYNWKGSNHNSHTSLLNCTGETENEVKVKIYFSFRFILVQGLGVVSFEQELKGEALNLSIGLSNISKFKQELSSIE